MQMEYLEEWALIELDYSSSLTGANEALTASILRLPIAGAKVFALHSFFSLHT